jgi:hypothetical protein
VRSGIVTVVVALAVGGSLAACGGGSSAATSGAGGGGGAGNNNASVAASGSSGAVTPSTSGTGGAGGSGFGSGLNSILPSAGATGATGGAGGSAGTVVGSPSPQPAASHTTTETSLVMFSSPSKNIACAMEAGYARCDIAQRTWAPPPKPASCDVDYGNGLDLSKGRAGISCAGDTMLGQDRILGYGQAIRVGSAVCASSAAGMRCADVTSGHGFVLAKEGYQIF